MYLVVVVVVSDSGSGSSTAPITAVADADICHNAAICTSSVRRCRLVRMTHCVRLFGVCCLRLSANKQYLYNTTTQQIEKTNIVCI